MWTSDLSADESETPGWISMTDSLILTTILLLGLTYGTARYAKGQHQTVIDQQKRISLLEAAERRIGLLDAENRTMAASIESLKAELARVQKDFALLQKVKGKITDAEQQLVTAQLELESIRSQLAAANLAVGDLKEKLTHAEKAVIDLNAEVTLLEQQSTKLLADIAAVTKTKNNLMRQLEEESSKRLSATTDAEKARVELQNAKKNEDELRQRNKLIQAQLDAFQDDSNKLNDLIKDLKTQNSDLDKQLQSYVVMLKRRNERIFKPLEAAKLVVRIRCKNLPMNIDLDLYVQDPGDTLCYWKQPRVQTASAEVATLVPSEDLRDFTEVKSPEATDSQVTSEQEANVTEEVYYAAEPITASHEKPYLVFCMLRNVGKSSSAEFLEQIVEWEVTVRTDGRPEETIEGESTISELGAIELNNGRLVYPGMHGLTGFTVAAGSSAIVRELPKSEMPEWPRGWALAERVKGAPQYEKIRDRELIQKN